MKYLAAYALVSLAGKTPSKADIEAVLKAAGVVIDASRIDAILAEMDGKNFDEVAAAGKSKFVGAGGAAPAAAASGQAAAAAAPAAAGKAAEPEEEEGDDDMGFGLFD